MLAVSGIFILSFNIINCRRILNVGKMSTAPIRLSSLSDKGRHPMHYSSIRHFFFKRVIEGIVMLELRKYPTSIFFISSVLATGENMRKLTLNFPTILFSFGSSFPIFLPRYSSNVCSQSLNPLNSGWLSSSFGYTWNNAQSKLLRIKPLNAGIHGGIESGNSQWHGVRELTMT